MRVSLLQMDIFYKDVMANVAHVKELMEKVVQERPDVIVLPEMWNTSYALKHLKTVADLDGQVTKDFMSQFAREHHVAIVAGSVSTNKNNHFYNTTYVFDRDGQLINDYDKVHLFGLMAEGQYLTAGQQESHFNIDGVPAASVICYDIRFPEWVRTLMSSGSQVLFVVAQWPDARVQQWEILLKARAVENQAYVVAVNRIGDAPGDHFSGHSLVIDPLGNVILQAPDDVEGVFTTELDLSTVEQVRGQIPVFADRRPDLYD